ncbi:HIT family protein [Nocardioides ferulae]|uniref:HIT family protein n=1 Tax=Nocardioides ferulae TaxID=2340821 RepID=UPI001F0C4F97|nr:HIT domain-containing protein [Nocardioides ferulae]
MSAATSDCPFCAIDALPVIDREGGCFAMPSLDGPQGSVMLLPFAHRVAPWDLTEEEWRDTRLLLARQQQRIAVEHGPAGWNVGWNVLPTGGQSVPHAHLHLLPRYADEPYAGRGLRWWFKHRDNARPHETSGSDR